MKKEVIDSITEKKIWRLVNTVLTSFSVVALLQFLDDDIMTQPAAEALELLGLGATDYWLERAKRERELIEKLKEHDFNQKIKPEIDGVNCPSLLHITANFVNDVEKLTGMKKREVVVTDHDLMKKIQICVEKKKEEICK